MPLSVLELFDIVPYKIGKTVSARQFRTTIEQEGFLIQHVAYIDHGPRFATIRFGKCLNNNEKKRRVWIKCLNRFEKMSHWPTACFTGYFHATLVVKEKAIPGY